MVSSIKDGLSYLVWGSNTNNANTVGSLGNAPDLTEPVNQNEIVKEGKLFKQSRYFKQWKR